MNRVRIVNNKGEALCLSCGYRSSHVDSSRLDDCLACWSCGQKLSYSKVAIELLQEIVLRNQLVLQQVESNR